MFFGVIAGSRESVDPNILSKMFRLQFVNNGSVFSLDAFVSIIILIQGLFLLPFLTG